MKRFHIKRCESGGWQVEDRKMNLAGECDNLHEVFMMCREWQTHIDKLLSPDRKVRAKAHEHIERIRNSK